MRGEMTGRMTGRMATPARQKVNQMTNLTTNRKTLLHVPVAAWLFATAVLTVAPVAQAQSAWQPEAYQRTKKPHKPAESEGPFFAWDPLRFGVAAEVQTTWLQDDNARRLVGRGATTAAGLSLHYEALQPSPRTAAKLDLAWTTATTSSNQSGSANLERFETNLLSLGVSLRYQVFRWLAPYARLAGGIGWDELSLGSGSARMHDTVTYGQGSVGGGLLLRSLGLCLRPSPTPYCAAFMGQVEGGYSLGTSSTFALKSAPATGVANPIPTESVPIGEMARHAPYLRISAGIAF